MATQSTTGASPIVLGQTPLESFYIEDVVRNSGKIASELKVMLPRSGMLSPPGNVLALAYWPRDWSFFNLQAHIEDVGFQDSKQTSGEQEPRDNDPFAEVADEEVEEGSDALLDNFITSQDGLFQLLTKFLGYDAKRAGETSDYFANKHRFIAGVVRVPTCLVLNIEIDTDNQKFIEWSRARNKEFAPNTELQQTKRQDGQCVLLPRLSIVRPQAETKIWTEWLGEKGRSDHSIAVYLGAVHDLAASTGILGFDIGNNNSTIAFLHNDAAGDHTKIELLRADPIFDESDESSNESSVLSTVRITHYKPNAKCRNFPLAKWFVGSEAVEITELGNGQVFHGAKRILGDLSRFDELSLVLDDLHSIPRSLPAELLITKMAQRVHQLLQMRAHPVVATYPSTYTRAEIERVRFGISKALHRCLNYLNVNDRTAAQRSIGLVPRVYDEASAAAFFYLYRDFMRGPGRLHGFHYLYPRGVNLLLFDCGGGTTDIALIHARTVPDGKLGGDALWGVHLINLGRTGNRYFGGDDITSAFFRVLKWRLAAALDPSIPAPPTSIDQIADDPNAQLKELATAIDEVIPTRVKRNRRQALGSSMAPQEKRRAQAVRGLWDWSERIKAWISSGCDGVVPSLAGGGALEKYVASSRGMPDADVRSKWDGIEWSWETVRATVDRMIKAEVDATIDSANALIGELDRRLQLMSKDGEANLASGAAFVHHVYLVGRASHYPYIRERLQRDLKMPYLEEFEDLKVPDRVRELARPTSDLGLLHPRLVFDTKNLKGAVVRGAVLMRMAENSIRGARVVYDEQLSERLPFAIGYDSDVVAPETLFDEHHRYDELPPVEVKAPDVPATTPRQSLVLHRRWPGTVKWEPFLEFSFDPPVQGKVIVRYKDIPENQKTLGFEVVHEDSGASAVGRVISRQPIVSPLERGDL